MMSFLFFSSVFITDMVHLMGVVVTSLQGLRGDHVFQVFNRSVTNRKEEVQ